MSLIHEQAAFLKDVRKLLEFADNKSYVVAAGELGRSAETQSLYLRSNRSETMDDMHLRKCAIDLYFFVDDSDHLQLVSSFDSLDEIGKAWESLDPRNRWGGRRAGTAIDTPRFERDLGAWPLSTTSALDPPPATLDMIAVSTPERPDAVTFASRPGALPVLRRGGRVDRTSILLLQEKLVKLNLLNTISGEFDQATESAVASFQRDKSLVVDGIVGEKTWTTLDAALAGNVNEANKRWLGDADLESGAKLLDVEVPLLKAVYKVESNGHGFVGDYPKILFEGHVFWKRLQARGINPEKVLAGNTDILYPKWTKAYYGNAAHERDRLRRAEIVDSSAALESASWGLFQIMGYHWKTLDGKYSSVNEFVERMKEHEREHLNAFCYFLKATKKGDASLADMLREKNWAGFAYSYNGSRYRANAYDDKLRQAYQAYKAKGAA